LAKAPLHHQFLLAQAQAQAQALALGIGVALVPDALEELPEPGRPRDR
jgi:hypothetical protein